MGIIAPSKSGVLLRPSGGSRIELGEAEVELAKTSIVTMVIVVKEEAARVYAGSLVINGEFIEQITGINTAGGTLHVPVTIIVRAGQKYALNERSGISKVIQIVQALE